MRAAALILLLPLAACTTPRERCEADAAAPYRAALQERAMLSRDLARGYTFQTRFERRTRFGLCTLPNGGFYQCWESDTQPVTRRVPVDAVSLRTRLDRIETDLAFLRAAAATDTRQCRALYPEQPDAG